MTGSGRRLQSSDVDVDAGLCRSESSDTALFPQKSARRHSCVFWQKGGAREHTNDDEEKGGANVKRPNRRMGAISQCREISQSPWLHFPHLVRAFRCEEGRMPKFSVRIPRLYAIPCYWQLHSPSQKRDKVGPTWGSECTL